jgi:uncharacterized protein YecT (DUF1311 family)
MKYSLSVLAPLLLAVSAATFAKTRYSGEFDYRSFQPSAAYFAGQTRVQIDHLCRTGEHAGTEDMEQCGRRDFERSTRALNQAVAALTVEYRKDNVDLTHEGEPAALPYFLKAQAAWVEYRDNSCYSAAYEIGEASLKYIDFWYCMATRTNERVKELRRHSDE